MKKTLFAILALFPTMISGYAKEPVKLKVGHVGHDHHLALFVALESGDKYEAEAGIKVKTIEKKQRYELYRQNVKIADIEVKKVGGGSKMPVALSQNIIDMACGGIAPVLVMIDKGAPIKLIAPLHSKGDMFVMKKDSKVKTWKDFVELAKSSKKPIRIGYKSPAAVAKIILEDAMKHEGITFSTNLSKSDVNVHLINVKGGGKLNASLVNGIIDGYTGNNPFPAIGESKGILKVICDLEELPPGRFKDHPCCGIAATEKAIKDKDKAQAIEAVLFLMNKASNAISMGEDKEVLKIASKWIGTTEEVEAKSIPTSGYSMTPNEKWHKTMQVWAEAMNKLGIFKNDLKGLKESEMAKKAYDFTILKKAIPKD
jgi:NitT/TauT family transport system substrate-binding protein